MKSCCSSKEPPQGEPAANRALAAVSCPPPLSPADTLHVRHVHTSCSQWKEDRREGTGTQRDMDGSVYAGQWLSNKKHGKGKWRKQGRRLGGGASKCPSTL